MYRFIQPKKISVVQDIQKEFWAQQKKKKHPWHMWDDKILKRSKSEEKINTKLHLPHFDNKEAKKDLREYLLTSTLHGLRYIGDGKLTWFERFFWLTSFVCSIICAGFFIMNIYEKWLSSPMIVSINPKNMALQNLPFPAITICNVNQAKKSIAYKYIQNGTSLDRKLLQSLCVANNDTAIFDNSSGIADWNYYRTFLINVTQPCTEMLAECFWNSEREECADLFNSQLTDEGLCCTFNVVHRDMMFRNPNDLNDMNITFPSPAVDWTPEGGYPEDAPAKGFPWRPLGVGTHHGLTLVLDANIPEYYCASTSHTGFKLLLHNPTESPKIAKLGDIIGPGVEIRCEILPRIMDAQRQILSIDLNKRQCVFSSEKNLMFYRTYTQRNCEMECEASTLLERCNCVLYYMPKNRTTRICGKVDAECYDAKTHVPVSEEEIKAATCNCMPSCTEIAYSVRMSSAPLNEKLVRQNKYLGNESSDYFMTNMLVIHFFFEDNSFIRYTKGEIFGLTEFLSNTGGLLGLCMGFSVMSFVEVLYFITLRSVCATHRQPRRPFIS